MNVSVKEMMGTSNRNKIVRALFRDKQAAERAFERLLARGYSHRNVNVVMSDEQHGRHIVNRRSPDSSSPISRTDIKFPDLMEEGVTVGALVGAVIGSITTMVLFGRDVAPANILGFTVNGMVALAVMGACLGGLLLGIAGAVIGARFPEESMKLYGDEISDGVVVTVRVSTEEESEDAAHTLEEAGGEQVKLPTGHK